ncbi:TVP38/TMEM64 family protein [Candidatus Woesearchaeota archaeon]|nr:TVP38/TMEM64 family protein [Candidatus Woesearchaeota archaeon]
MIKKRHHPFRFIIFLLILIAIYFLASEVPLVKQYLSNPESLKAVILGFGILAPLAIIILQFFQTTISILPSQITTIVAGFVFGPILGLAYSLIGAFFGSMFIFLIARKYGKKLALKIFEKKSLVHFNALFKRKKRWAVLLTRMAPIFPNDVVSFGAGLTDIKLKYFNLFSTIGFIIQMIILTYFGAELSTGKISLPLILVSSAVTLLILIALFAKPIKRIIIKDFHKLDNTIEKEFKKI